MRQKQVMNVNYLSDKRRELRNNMTSAEAALWKELKGGKLGNKKFRRQHSIGNYIVDFCCPAEKLIIELDGQVHLDAQNSIKDIERDAELKSLGFTVLRFENRVVFLDIVGVLGVIASHFKSN